MELFEPVEGAFDEGGLMQEGGTVDPESGNEVPVGSTQEEVRDDIPAQLSEGEFVFPADVVRYIGLEKLMQMRQEAKRGLEMMDKMGQMGNSDEAVIPDDVPFDMSDLDMEDDGMLEFQTGGFVPGIPTPQQQAVGISSFTPSQFTNYQPQFTPYTPPTITPTTGLTQQFTPTINQQAPTFTNLTGSAQPEPGGYDEMRTYVNDAGMEMQIPFKNGQPIYPIPQGYKVKGEAVKTTTDVKTETTKTAASEQQDSGDEPSDPFAGKQTVNLGGTVVTERTKRKEGELSGFKPGQVRGSTRYSIGSASSVTGDLSKRTTADKEGVNRIFAGLKDSIAEFGRGLANQDQKTLTKEDGSKITLSEALFESIMGDRFSGKTNEVLADIFEIQSTIEKNFGENYNKDLDNRQAKDMAKAAGIEYKGQSLAELIATGVDSDGNRLKDSFVKDPEIKKEQQKTRKEQQQEAAFSAGEKRKQEAIAAAANLPAGYKISTSGKSATQILNEVREQTAKKARDDATRAAEKARNYQYYDSSGDSQGPDIFGGTGQMGGSAAEKSSGYQTSTGEAMVAEGGLIKKAKLAQQMKQSGLASKK